MPFRIGGNLHSICKVNNHLFICGSTALKKDTILSKKISLIVNVTTEDHAVHISNMDYMNVRVEDEPSANIDAYFDIVADRIHWTKESGGRTLVHCVAGVSRSATLCIVYLMKYEKMPLREAYYFLKAVRPVIRPNAGFWKQLIEYEKILFGANSVRMIVSSTWNDLVPDVYAEERRSSLSTLNSLAHGSNRSSSVCLGANERSRKRYGGAAGAGHHAAAPQNFLSSFYSGHWINNFAM